jgi:hypothetical protein
MRIFLKQNIFTLLLFFLFFPTLLMAQKATVKGKIIDEAGEPVELANIAIKGEPGGTTSNRKGLFTLEVPAGKKVIIAISYIGLAQKEIEVNLKPGEEKSLSIDLKSSATTLPGLEIKDEKLRTEGLVRLNPKNTRIAPSVNESVESIIQTLPGVSTTSEMSSQYSVRGGNFDENLVYVNDIEVYRPFLVNAGQQEGLSFINPAMVSSILFSAGGFGAQYGDKMSSVLDVRYKKPTEFGGTFSVSLLGAEISVRDNIKDKFTYLVGARYKTNSYLVNSLDTKGNYKPNFFDVQSLFEYKFNPKWSLSFLGYYSGNQYNLIPTDRVTDYGTFKQAMRFKVYFDGQEVDSYNVAEGGLTLNYNPNNTLHLKLIASAFNTRESETYDVQGQYWIGLLDNNPGSEDFDEVTQSLGVGTYLEHARNRFDATVMTLEHKGSQQLDNQNISWGVRFQHQIVDDRIREWQMIDSAGYSLPNPPASPGNPNPDRPGFELDYFMKDHHQLTINRFSAFIADDWKFRLKNNDMITLTAGLRGYYGDINNEFTLSPRLNFSYKPYKNQNFVLRFATGIYYQPPFYREMRDMDGSLNTMVKSQRSIHFILGSDYQFKVWNRPFIFTTELYYKKLDNLVPYMVDNVRIRYYANQIAKGYAAGIDFRINGEFVKGVDSWASLSIMKTAEDVEGDYYYNYYNEDGELIGSGIDLGYENADSTRVEPGYIPRPSDRRVTFAIFFQDYIPNYPTWKVHLKLIFGTGMPFGAPGTQRYQQTLRMPDYRRVDLGFSKQFMGDNTKYTRNHPNSFIKSFWVSLDIFNLFGVYNTVSYMWVKDIYNRQNAIPNYLTPRLFNLKLSMEF